MTFGHPAWTWLLLVAALFAFGCINHLRRHGERLARFADPPLFSRLIPASTPLLGRAKWNAYRSGAIGLLLAITVVGPRWGYEWRPSQRRGFDVVVALDLSESMLARDVTPSRLDRARHELKDLLSMLRGDRIGLVSFAGVAFVESPLTLDYAAFRMFLDGLDPTDVPIQGTNIALALEKSLEVLTGTSEEKQGVPAHGRAVLLVTDGEEFEGDLSGIREKLKAAGVRVFVIGVGTKDGGPIPMKDGGYKRDREGKIVISSLKQEVINKLAEATGGVAVNSIASGEDVRVLYDSGMRRLLTAGELGGTDARRWHEYFQVPLLLAVLLLLSGPWSALTTRFSWLRRAAPLIVLVAMAPGSAAHADSAEAAGDRARKTYDTGDFEAAARSFKEAREMYGDDPRFLMGQGASAYRQNNYPLALELFSKAAELDQAPAKRGFALFNSGNSLVQENDYDKAIDRYTEALKLLPDDEDIKANLEYAKRMKQQQQQKKSGDRNKKQKPDKGDKQDQPEKSDSSEQQDHNPDQQQQQQDNQQQQDKQQQSDDQSKRDEQQKGDDQDRKEGNGASPAPTPAPSPSSGAQSSAQSDSGDGASPAPQPSGGQQGDAQQPSPIPSSGSSPAPTPKRGGSSAADNPDEQGQPSPQPAPGDLGNEGKNSNDQNVNSTLESVEERSESRKSYRLKKGAEQLRNHGEERPEKDW